MVEAETEAGEEEGAEVANPGVEAACNEVVVVDNRTWACV